MKIFLLLAFLTVFFSFQARISYDRVYSTNTQRIIQISFPLDFFSSSICKENRKCHRFRNQQVQRNAIILTDQCLIGNGIRMNKNYNNSEV